LGLDQEIRVDEHAIDLDDGDVVQSLGEFERGNDSPVVRHNGKVPRLPGFFVVIVVYVCSIIRDAGSLVNSLGGIGMKCPIVRVPLIKPPVMSPAGDPMRGFVTWPVKSWC